jgi:hypothetical protein
MVIQYDDSQEIGKPGITIIRYDDSQEIGKINNLNDYLEQIF